MQNISLSDGIITLSPLHPDDAEAHLAGEDQLLVRWLSGTNGTRDGVTAYLRHCQQQWDTGGPLQAFGIRVGADNVLAGTIDLRWATDNARPGLVPLAYGLYPHYRRRGLATRAVLVACRYVASEGGTHAIIRVAPDNVASAAVARRAGFAADTYTYGQDGTRLDCYTRDVRSIPTAPSAVTTSEQHNLRRWSR